LKYSVPKHHNEKLISPPFEELGAAVESNRRRMEGYGFSLGGESFPDFRLRAREEVLSAPPTRPVVLSAHQPGIPHMGVVEKLRLLQTLSAGNFQASNVPSGKTATFVVDAGSTALYVQIVPEPGAMALAACGVATLFWGCRRRLMAR